MRIGHEQIVVAYARHALVVNGAPVHGDGLAKYIAVADFETRRLTLVFLVLRRISQGGELEDLVAGTDAGRAVDHHMGTDPGAGADDDVGADDGKWSYLDVRRDLRLRRYHRARIDHPGSPFALGPLVSGDTMISADATSAPATSATP